ncbi:uncharacterized protein F5147DRAFT_775291 [Suillus discolor]|uniref:Uncharacterized protein n=1 Tax=Suillus discolor TaxID=1912936 RepID=A0A9P7F4T9_9AGAM|nr:uncharacterized protein F5147DRAFT_775291 [Suillus discolor]KAG2105516.1 hypothetical protein F5147DRAFT_775291 [Suillus discolor]
MHIFGSNHTTDDRSDFIDTDQSSGYSSSSISDFAVLPDSEGPSSYWLPDSSLSRSASPEIWRDPPILEINVAEQLALNMTEGLYQVFHAGGLLTRVGAQQQWSICCPDCEEWCQTSLPSGIPLWDTGHFNALSAHRGSKKCLQTIARRHKEARNVSASDEPITRSPSFTSDQSTYNFSAAHPDNCPGLLVVWLQDLPPFIMFLPWERYHDGLDGLPFIINLTQPSTPYIRSKCCFMSTLIKGSPCGECTELSAHVNHLSQTAWDPKPHTNYKYLGLTNMRDIAQSYADQARQLRLQGLNASHEYISALSRLDDYHRLLMAISEHDIPHLQQIINVALGNGTSVREIINKLEDALEGAYRPWGYGADDLDIATLLSIPSLRTLRTRAAFTTISPTIGTIRDEHFDTNIQSGILSTRADITSLHGVSIMIDEMAIEEMAVHYSRYNKIGGLCWKHSNLIDPVLRTYDSAVAIAQKIHDEEVHLGKEVTMIGAACFSEDELYPILVAPTCKTEDATDMEGVLKRALQCWKATGADQTVGPIWSLATDGDATRRAAGHRLFVKKPLSSESLLYGILINMPGLNMWTGDDDVTLDFDPKHIFKRICTLICSPLGITLNNGQVINAMMLSRYLVWLPAYDEVSVMKLLHPNDPQDVPRAVELIKAIIGLTESQRDFLNDSFSPNIDRRADLMSIVLLSDVIKSFLIPFINVNLSLTEQVQYLSRFTHLSFTLFRSHQRSFMSHQLYYDMHTMVKSIMFSIVKQQVLDPHASFFLGDSGDDRLELHFGRTQMIGGHNSGCSFSQVINRLGAAKDIDGVLKHHPELDPGHRHLSLGTRVEDIDHINRDMWKDDIVSGCCDLPTAWRNGREMAISILSTSQVDPINFSFIELFHDLAIDMLRPFGENKYFGISEADKELLPQSPLVPVVTSHDNVVPNSHPIPPAEADSKEVMLTFEKALTAESISDAPPTGHHLPLLVDPSAPPLPEGPGIHPDDYLLFKGQWIHKQMVCHLVINKDFISKSHNRLERIRAGYTKVNKRIDMSAGRITDQHSFLIGDIFLTIFCSGLTLSIGILRSTLITLLNISCASMNIAVMKASQSTIKVTGQLLTIIPTCPSPESPTSFLWNGGYMKAHSIIPGTEESTEHVVVVSVPGSLVEPVNPKPMFIQFRDDINPDQFQEIKGGQSTWQVHQDALQAACDILWAKAVETKVPLKSIVQVSPSDTDMFPYRSNDGTLAIISIEAGHLLSASKGKCVTTCPLCHMKVTNICAHIGQHILRVSTNTPEKTSLKEPVGDALPWGFCGRSGLPECAITIKVPASGTPDWEMKCAYRHMFKYGFADHGSKNNPCRNVPLKCGLCHPTLPPKPGKTSRKVPVAFVQSVWRYNMTAHIFSEHEEYAIPGCREAGVPLPESVWESMELSELKQASAGIPTECRQPSHKGKENVPASGSRSLKHSATASVGPMTSKHVRTTIKPLQTACTLLV